MLANTAELLTHGAMFVRKVNSGPCYYLRIVENYRDKATGKVRQRIVTNLCRIEGDEDEKMAILANVADMEVEEVVHLYKNRSDIEWGFRTMKEELEIAPVYHRLQDRISVHAAICYLALLLNRCLCFRLRKCGRIQSPREALRVFKSIQLMKAKVNGKEVEAISNRIAEQLNLFKELELEDCSLSHYG